MREQSIRVKTGMARKRASVLAAALVTAALAGIIVFALQYEPSYKPPAFEAETSAGVPSVPEGFDYSTVDAAGKFKFMLTGTMYQQEDSSLRVYFTSPEENEAYLMCEVTDSEGITLYKSGLLRPGEYMESLKPVTKLKNEAIPITINIYAFESENFYSVGSVTLNNILQPY